MNLEIFEIAFQNYSQISNFLNKKEQWILDGYGTKLNFKENYVEKNLEEIQKLESKLAEILNNEYFISNNDELY